MEHNIKLVAGPDDVIDNSRIIQDWMVEENNRMREANILNTAREEGREEGKEIGFKKGMEQGIEYGMEQGTRQGEENKALEVIKNMLHEGADYNFISKVTGKSTIQVKEIENSLLIPNA